MIEDGIYVAFNEAGGASEAVIVEDGTARGYMVSRFDDMDIYEYWRVDDGDCRASVFADEHELCETVLHLQWTPEVQGYEWDRGFPEEDRGSEPADIIDFFQEEIWD